VAPNVLDRQFTQGAPDRAWVAIANLDTEALEKQQKKAFKRQQRQTLERSKHHAQIDKLVPDSDSSVPDSNI
jgi:hypothetical protein